MPDSVGEAMRDVQQPEISSAGAADGNSIAGPPSASTAPPPPIAPAVLSAEVAAVAAVGKELHRTSSSASREGSKPPVAPAPTLRVPLDSSGPASGGGDGGARHGIEGFVVDAGDDDEGLPGSAESERSVAKAMAEAILDEGYMAGTPASTAATAAYLPRSPAPTHQHRPTQTTTANGDRQPVAATVAAAATAAAMPAAPAARRDYRTASPAPVAAAAAAVDDASSCDPQLQQQRQQQDQHANAFGVATPSCRKPAPSDRRSGSDGRGVDAPFGHAIIIEEHVRAGVSTRAASQMIPAAPGSMAAAAAPAAAAPKRATLAGRGLLSSGRAGTQSRTPAIANGVGKKTSSASAAAVAAIASAAGALVPTPPAGSGSSSRHAFSLGRRSNGSVKVKNGLEKGVAKADKVGRGQEEHERRVAEWCATEDAGGNDGFLVLEGGGRSSAGRTGKRNLAAGVARGGNSAARKEGTSGEGGSGVDEQQKKVDDNLWPVAGEGGSAGLPEAEGGWGHVSTNG
ncbi:unnamed protein product, partial [Scytosiphon promiscuus]